MISKYCFFMGVSSGILISLSVGILGGAGKVCASFGRAVYGGGGCSAWLEAPPKIRGLHPDPRRRSRHSRGEKYVLAGGAGQNMISFSFPACGRGNSARRALPGESVGRKGRWGPLGLFCGLPPGPAALPGESVGRKGIGYPIGGFPTPKAFPSGGRCPSAHTGADEGAIWYPTFPCRKGGLLTVAPTGCFSCPVGQPGRPLISHLR